MSLGFPFRFHPVTTSVNLQDRLWSPVTHWSAPQRPWHRGSQEPNQQDRTGPALQTKGEWRLSSGSPPVWGGAGCTVGAREGERRGSMGSDHLSLSLSIRPHHTVSLGFSLIVLSLGLFPSLALILFVSFSLSPPSLLLHPIFSLLSFLFLFSLCVAFCHPRPALLSLPLSLPPSPSLVLFWL